MPGGEGVVVPEEVVVAEDFDKAFSFEEFFLPVKYFLVMFLYGTNPVFPEFFAITQADIGKVVCVIIIEGRQVIFFRTCKIIGSIATAFVLIGEDDEAIIDRIKRDH